MVVHCAAILDEKNPELFKVNVEGTKNVLEAAAQNKVEQFIHVSSVGVYGQQKGLKDESTPTKPSTRYEESKLEAEKLVNNYQEVFHTTILRPAIVLGENKYWESIVKTIAKNYPLPCEGKNKWQMVSVEDVVSAIIHSIKNPDFYEETFIVAEKKPLTLQEVVEIIRENSGLKKRVIKIPVLLAKIVVELNKVFKFSELLTPEYLQRLQADRHYSIKKIESTGWKPRHESRKDLPSLVKKILAKKQKIKK